MGFTYIVPSKIQKAQGVSCTFAINKRSERGQLVITLPSAMTGGRQWDKQDHCSFAIGDGEDAGKILVQPSGEGPFKIARFKTAIILRVPEQKGWGGTPFKNAAAQHEWITSKAGPHGLLLTLPEAVFTGSKAATAQKPHAGLRALAQKPSLIGNVLTANGKRVRLSASMQISIMTFLVRNFGQEKSFASLIEFMGGGAMTVNADTVRATISTLRKVIAPCALQIDTTGSTVRLVHEVIT
jgi:hypothetical protein